VSASPVPFPLPRIPAGLRWVGRTLGVVALLPLAACGGGSSAGGSTSGSSPVPDPLMAVTVAMTWEGDLPCASCEGIRTTVTLFPDGTFRRDDTYLGEPEAEGRFGEVGRFFLDRSGERVTLLGSRGEPAYFLSLSDYSIQLLDGSGLPIQSELNYTLIHLPAPVPHPAPLRLTGALVEEGGVLHLLECGGGVPLPLVADGAAYESIRAAWEESLGALGRGASALHALPVALRGTLEDRPGASSGGALWTLRADTFDGESLGSDCAVMALREALASGEWTLIELGGDPVVLPPSAREAPTLAWDPESGRVSGYAGCNRYTGGAMLAGSLLLVGDVARTLMLCEGLMELESRVIELFQGGKVLRLDSDGSLLLSRGPYEAARFRRL